MLKNQVYFLLRQSGYLGIGDKIAGSGRTATDSKLGLALWVLERIIPGGDFVPSCCIVESGIGG